MANEKLSLGDVTLRYPRVSDAKRSFEILNNKNFHYLASHPKSIQNEKDFLKNATKNRKKNLRHDFAILYRGIVIGGIGVKINQHMNWIGEMGFFIEERYWGKGITTRAIKLFERYCFKTLKLHRIEILMNPKNYASEKVAIKNKYEKEGLLRSIVKNRAGKWSDNLLYAKINSDGKAEGLHV